MANIKRANASGITKSGTAISDVPDAPTIGAVSDLGTGSTASVAYTAATTGGAATTFTATSSPGGFTGTGSSPITVSGLTAGTAYTFTVTASNSTGSSPASSASSSLTLASVGAFESIASATGTGSSGTITFSSIPSTYKHLQIRWNARIDTNVTTQNLRMQVNADTGSNYAIHWLYGDGSTADVTGSASATFMHILAGTAGASATANIMGVGILDILDYSSTTKNKTVKINPGTDLNGSGGYVSVCSGLWISTSAITSISLYPPSGNFTTASTFALYGIKGA